MEDSNDPAQHILAENIETEISEVQDKTVSARLIAHLSSAHDPATADDPSGNHLIQATILIILFLMSITTGIIRLVSYNPR